MIFFNKTFFLVRAIVIDRQSSSYRRFSKEGVTFVLPDAGANNTGSFTIQAKHLKEILNETSCVPLIY